MKTTLFVCLFFFTYCFNCLAQEVDSIMKYRGGYVETSRDQATGNGFYYIVYPELHSSSLLSFTTPTSTGTFQMEAFYWGDLKFRNKTDNNVWQGWKTIWTDANLNPNNYLGKAMNIWHTDINNNPRLYFEAPNGTGSGTTYFQGHGQMPFEFRSANGHPLVKINANGNMSIGTAPRNDYRLTVEGTVGARKVKVTQESWADFVFDPQYKLPTLLEVELFIQKNRHLPEIPSANEVLEEGIDLGDMNKKLLQKVEELTLYVIELKKENERQQKQLDKLDKRF